MFPQTGDRQRAWVDVEEALVGKTAGKMDHSGSMDGRGWSLRQGLTLSTIACHQWRSLVLMFTEPKLVTRWASGRDSETLEATLINSCRSIVEDVCRTRRASATPYAVCTKRKRKSLLANRRLVNYYKGRDGLGGGKGEKKEVGRYVGRYGMRKAGEES